MGSSSSESALCSRRDSTSPERHRALLSRLAAAPLSLMAMLASPCALVVEHAALLLGALAEHSPPREMAALRDHALSEVSRRSIDRSREREGDDLVETASTFVRVRRCARGDDRATEPSSVLLASVDREAVRREAR